VVLRLRSFLDMLTRECRGDRALVVAHQVIVNCMRYLLERLDERQILAIDRRGDVPNCGITSYVFGPRARGGATLARRRGAQGLDGLDREPDRLRRHVRPRPRPRSRSTRACCAIGCPRAGRKRR
jgi:broad specificity phosphatase PhoE